MEEKKQTGEREKLVIDGNALYEIDLECVRRKEQEAQEREKRRSLKRQRN